MTQQVVLRVFTNLNALISKPLFSATGIARKLCNAESRVNGSARHKQYKLYIHGGIA